MWRTILIVRKIDNQTENMNKKAIILAISILVISSNFQAVSAEIFFPSTNVRLEGSLPNIA